MSVTNLEEAGLRGARIARERAELRRGCMRGEYRIEDFFDHWSIRTAYLRNVLSWQRKWSIARADRWMERWGIADAQMKDLGKPLKEFIKEKLHVQLPRPYDQRALPPLNLKGQGRKEFPKPPEGSDQGIRHRQGLEY